MYAILSHGGRQYRVSAGDRLVVDRLDAEVGSVVALEPVLLTGGDGKTALGADLDGLRVAVTVVAHRRGEKLRIFKYKAKKRSRKVAGYRSDLTELRVESILAKGAALPQSTAPAPGPRASSRTIAEKPGRAAPRARRSTTTQAVATSSAATDEAPKTAKAAAAKPTASAARRTSSAAPKPRATGRAATTGGKGSAEPVSKPAAAAGTKPTAKAKAKAKAAPKRSTRGGPTAGGKEKGDGA
jgi:large subunit ribosomal protein L21